jgi:hypothetical protein
MVAKKGIDRVSRDGSQLKAQTGIQRMVANQDADK